MGGLTTRKVLIVEEDQRGGCRNLFFFAFRMFFTVILVFILLSTVSYFVIRSFVIVGEQPVPNVVGLMPAQALEQISQKKFTMTLEKYDYSRVLEEGRIMSQYPAGGVRAKIGSPVRVVLSKGSPLVSVPDVRGDTEVSAGIKIRAADLSVGTISRKYDARVKKDDVIAQDPPPQAGIARNYAVKLLVSLGAAPGEYAMPSLVHLTLAEATELIENLGMTISEIRKLDSSLPKNRVVEQNPPSGAILNQTKKIVLSVSNAAE
jgi:serine/threonine-protein kinase